MKNKEKNKTQKMNEKKAIKQKGINTQKRMQFAKEKSVKSKENQKGRKM